MSHAAKWSIVRAFFTLREASSNFIIYQQQPWNQTVTLQISKEYKDRKESKCPSNAVIHGLMLSLIMKTTCFYFHSIKKHNKKYYNMYRTSVANDSWSHLVIYIYWEKSLEGSRQFSGKIEDGKMNIYFGFLNYC